MERFSRNKNTIVIVSGMLVVISVLVAIKLLSQAVEAHYDSERIVCIDAGHGGSDSGATSTDGKRLEKDDNLRLALKVRDKLEEMDVKVVMTRDDDSDITLKERCKLANKKRCDLFVAIHRNSSATGSGYEAWISDTAKGNEEKTANELLQNLSKIDSLANRGVKSGYRDDSANNYYVNANTNMPSILLEVGFVTSAKDNEAFDKYLDDYAQAIAETINNSL